MAEGGDLESHRRPVEPQGDDYIAVFTERESMGSGNSNSSSSRLFWNARVRSVCTQGPGGPRISTFSGLPEEKSRVD